MCIPCGLCAAAVARSRAAVRADAGAGTAVSPLGTLDTRRTKKVLQRRAINKKASYICSAACASAACAYAACASAAGSRGGFGGALGLGSGALVGAGGGAACSNSSTLDPPRDHDITGGT